MVVVGVGVVVVVVVAVVVAVGVAVGVKSRKERIAQLPPAASTVNLLHSLLGKLQHPFTLNVSVESERVIRFMSKRLIFHL